MIYHMLPGDAQVEAFRESGIEGVLLVCREALVEGDLSGDTLDEFFLNRAAFINGTYDSDPSVYNATVASQFRKLTELGDKDEINLWFEYELFCSVNMWFCLDLLKVTGASLFRVAPLNTSPDNVWEGFGQNSEDDLIQCNEARIRFSQEDISVGSQLWEAYRNRDSSAIRALSTYRSPCFPFLNEVCNAAVDIDTQPIEFVKELKARGLTELETLFPEFRRIAGVYGFGDSQVESLMRHL